MSGAHAFTPEDVDFLAQVTSPQELFIHYYSQCNVPNPCQRKDNDHATNITPGPKTS